MKADEGDGEGGVPAHARSTTLTGERARVGVEQSEREGKCVNR